MKFYLFLFLITSQFCFAQNDKLEWVKSFGGNDTEFSNSITTSKNGDVYTTGWFSGIVDFDPSTTVLNISSQGMTDIYIQKLDAQGNLLWVKTMGGSSDEGASTVEVDFNGNVYITGSFRGTVDFDPGVGVTNLTSSSWANMYILKLDSLGDFLWVKNFGNNNSSRVHVQSSCLKTDSLGNVYTIGRFSDTIDFDPGAGITQLTTPINGQSCFILKLDSLGTFNWVKSTEGGGPLGVSFSIFGGDIFVTGFFYGTVDFDPGSGVHNVSSANSLYADVFVLKLNSQGIFSWVKTIQSTTASTFVSEITLDIMGNIFLTGYFDGTADFDPGVGLATYNSNGVSDIYILKLNSNGNFIWVRCMGNTSDDYGISITTDSIGNCYAAGSYTYSIDFDSVLTNICSTTGGTGGYILKLSPLGHFLWSLPSTSTGGWSPRSITKSKTCGVYSTGFFSRIINFEGNDTITSNNGSVDPFVLKICQSIDSKHQISTDSLLCQFDTVNFAVSYLSCVDSLGWSFGDTNSGTLNYSGDLEPYHIFNSYGTFPIQVIVYSNCSLDTIYDTIYVTQSPIANLGNDTVLCEGDSLWVQIIDSSYSVLWGNGDSSLYTQVLHPGTFTIEVSGICGPDYDTIVVDSVISAIVHLPSDSLLCDNDSLFLDASIQSGTYLWSNGSTDSAIWAAFADTFWVTSSNFCGSSSDTIITTYIHSPYFEFGADTILCVGDTIVLSAYDTLSQFQWSTNEVTAEISVISTGNYSVTTTNVCGSFSDSLFAWFLNRPVVNIGGNTILCEGDSFSLFVPGFDTNWIWSTGEIDSTLMVSSPGVYSVSVSNICGTTSDTISITRETIPIINPAILDTSFCEGSSYQVNVIKNNSSTILWYDGDTNYYRELDVEGWYNYSLINACGTTQDTFELEIYYLANSDLGDDTIICYGEQIVKSFQYPKHSYFWNNGLTDSVQFIIKPGIYGVSIFTPEGCESYDEFVVSICEGQLFIPNAFTPNSGDELNNKFIIKGEDIRKFTINIYDRWGKEVFQSNDLNNSWDGLINGQDAASGIYSYMVWYNTGLSSISITKYGMINLIR
jgi:gliding motility-associated-like protein